MEKLKEYLKNELTTEHLYEMVQEVNAYNGELDYLQYYENNDDFFNTFYDNNPYEVARAIYFGSYNFNDYYVRIDVYGNLETLDEFEFCKELADYNDEIIDAFLRLYEENKNYIEYTNAYNIIKDFEEMESKENE